MKYPYLCRALFAAVFAAAPLRAATENEQIKQLRDELNRLRTKVETLESQIEHPHEEAGHSKLAQAFGHEGEAHFDFSLIGSVAAGTSTGDPEELEIGGHDPKQRGFNLQSLELIMSGSVDPYFDALAVLLFGLDTEGKAFVEIEEAWLETASLPWDLKLRAGQLLTPFGRFNTTHLHQWSFVDGPLVNASLLGEDGLRSPGAQISWTAPTPFHSEFTVAIQNAQNHEHDHHEGEAGHEGHAGAARMEDMLFAGRYAAGFDLSRTQSVLAGVSGAVGRNASGDHHHTSLLGADFFWKWKPQADEQTFVSWQSEVIYRSAELQLEHEESHSTEETGRDWGFYSQLCWGFKPRWVAGLRTDYLKADDDLDGQDRWRISPNITWFPSESTKLRLQHNFDIGEKTGADHSVWLEFEFALGAHPAHPH